MNCRPISRNCIRPNANTNMNPLKTCIVTPEAIGPFTNGGVGTAAYRLAELLTQNDHAVTLLYTGDVMGHVRADWKAYYYDSRGIDIVILDAWRPDPTEQTASINHDASLTIEAVRSEKVKTYLIRNPFAIVYFQDYMGNGLRSIQAKRCGCALSGTQLIVWCHSSFTWALKGNSRMIRQQGDLIREAHERLAAQGADVVAVPSDYMKHIVTEEWKIARLEYLPLWHQKQSEDKSPNLIVHHDFEHLVFFGRIERRKGVDLLLGAVGRSAILQQRINQITFLGRQVDIEGIPAEDYIYDAWDGLDISWHIIDTLNTDEALAWLTDQKKILVIAPSVLDNFPYTVLETFLLRIPLVSTRVGGIPEIVGPANVEEMLVPPSVDGVQKGLERVFATQMLSVDYSAGYDPETAARKMLAFHDNMISRRDRDSLAGATEISDPAVDILLVCRALSPDDIRSTVSSILHCSRCSKIHLFYGNQLNESRRTMMQHIISDVSGSERQVELLDFDGQHSVSARKSDLLIVNTGERLLPTALKQLQRALHQGAFDMVSGYVLRHHDKCPGTTILQRPVGQALEVGCLGEYVVTTPCLISFRIREQFSRNLIQNEGDVYPSLLSCAFDHGRVGVLPEAVAEGGVNRIALREELSRKRISLLFGHHLNQLKSELFYPLLLDDAETGAQAAYLSLAKADDCIIEQSLSAKACQDSIPLIIQRLSPLVEAWKLKSPRLYLYGAGEHSKVILSLFPVIWQWVHGFIDARRQRSFLGKPCTHPEDMVFPPSATVLYSSRENELAMYANLQRHVVEQVLIYHPREVKGLECRLVQ